MEIVLLAVIGLVALLGLVAFAVGNRGWNWGTVAAAMLLVFAASGYAYLAARLAERERSWRAVVTKNQAEIDRIIGGDKPGAAAAPNALAALRHRRNRWIRALAFVDTWHGRSWKNATLSPPRDGQPGTISIEMPSDESEVGPLPAGGEVAVFDDAAVAEEGRFLGLFRVQAVRAAKEAENAQLTIVPASLPAPPSEAETKLWTRDYDAVTVYESLPVDRWLAFYKTPAEGGDAADGPDLRMPKPKKTSGEEALKDLEEQMTALERHDREVPKDEWPQLKTEDRDGKPRSFLVAPNGTEKIDPGRYWAVVEFSKAVKFKKKADKPGAGEFEVAAESDEDDGPGEAGAMIKPEAGAEEAGAELGKVPTDPDPTAGAVSRRFKEKKFESGEQAEFDLQTALFLQDVRQWATISRVIERRPLSDPFTAIRGAEFGAQADDGTPLRADGLDAVRQGLLVEMESIAQTLARVEKSRLNVETQAQAVATQAKQLEEDRTSWGKDVAAATTMADAFDARLRAATTELAARENAIVRLGNLLRANWAALNEAIDAAAR